MIKTSHKFQKNRNKTVEGVAHTRYPLSIHLNCTKVRKTTKFKLQKINLRIISKSHAHFQSMVKTSVKFPKKKKNNKKKKKNKTKKKTKKNKTKKNKQTKKQKKKQQQKKQQKNNNIGIKLSVGRVAHTRYPLSIHFHCKNAPKVAKFKLQKSNKN